MTPLFELTLRPSAVILLGLLLSAMLRHRSAAVRHAILAATLFAAAAVVPLSALVPAWSVAVPSGLAGPGHSQPVVSALSVTVGDGRAAQPPVVSMSLLMIVWGAGCVAGVVWLLTGLARLAWIARRARPVQNAEWSRTAEQLSGAYGVRRRVRLLQTGAPDLLATFGHLRPRVLLPAHAREWPAARIHAVLCHELAHVSRSDWLVQICAEVVRIVYWFNPLVWVACSRLRRESEQACDDVVLATGVPARDYAAHLLELARICRTRGPAWAPAPPMARASTLERRIAAMLNPALERAALSRRAIALAAALLACASLAIAAVRPAQNTSGSLAGSVYDPSGGVLPGVQIVLRDAQQVEWHGMTDSSGRFEFAAVSPGRYVLEATLAGFRSLSQEIDLRNPDDWDRAITLQVGEVRETISVRATRTAGSAGAQGLQPVRVGGNIRAPRKLLDVKPVYPATMRDAGREGIVPMEAVIGRDGLVYSVRVLSADVHPDFAIAAVDAVRQWRFDPTLLNGESVEVRMTISVEFRLSE